MGVDIPNSRAATSPIAAPFASGWPTADLSRLGARDVDRHSAAWTWK